MNNKRAKLIRQEIYRDYAHVVQSYSTNPHTGAMEADSRRKRYQDAKKTYKVISRKPN